MEAVILSHAQDTNGGNQRFAKAAARHGTGKAVLRALAIGNDDPAGVVGRYRIAAEKLGGLTIRSVAKTSHYFDWPQDIVWDRSTEPLVRKLIDEADVIHLNNSYRPVQRYHIRKPMLLHHHGSLFRNNTEYMMKTAAHRKWVQAVSTIDLTRPDPELLHWLPTAYDVRALQAYAKKHRRPDDGRIRIVHCPTNRALKATSLLIAAVDELRAEGLPLDLVIVEGRTWADTMAEKAKADILFDQTLFGYGCNAVEAWAMGIPVIAGADPWTLHRMQGLWGDLPFCMTTDTMIDETLRALATEPDLRAEYAERGTAHVLKYHDERPALAKLAELYALTIHGFHDKPRRASDAVRFRNTGRSTVHVDDFALAPRGDVTTDDPDVIQRLRVYAKRGPRFGIEEMTG